MPGFLRAVINTYQHIALGTLQGHLQPWRPTVSTVGYQGKGCAVIRADLPADRPHRARNWRPVGDRHQVNENRIDIIEWLDVNDTGTAAGLTRSSVRGTRADQRQDPRSVPHSRGRHGKAHRPGVLRSWDQLLDSLQGRALAGAASRPSCPVRRRSTSPHPERGRARRSAVSRRCRHGADRRGPGCPVRGRAIDPARRRTSRRPSHVGKRPSRWASLESPAASADELFDASVPWVHVYDGRPESVLRRAAGRPTEKLAGARILLLGCGGLGAPIAEHCVRSGAARLHIVDSGTVSPGFCRGSPMRMRTSASPRPRYWPPGLAGSARKPKSPRRSPTSSLRTCSPGPTWANTTWSSTLLRTGR